MSDKQEIGQEAPRSKTKIPPSSEEVIANKSQPEKPPKIEEKDFTLFINENLIPELYSSLKKNGLSDTNLTLQKGKMPVSGIDCWILYGEITKTKRFWLCFKDENIKSQKTIAISESTNEPSILESFLIDERKITLSLLVSRILQRLNGQKWLGPN